ncbi:MAG: helix-turn-helix domain-containing protein [Sphingobacteriia bacterium]|nr:helix-turn-helix domain-containing protein [Sphingobacteriia bacterium]
MFNSDNKTVGDILKEARENLGLSIQDISNSIKVNSRYIKAIENNEVEGFLNLVYFKGYINIYANFLNIKDPSLKNKVDEFISNISVKEIKTEDTENFNNEPFRSQFKYGKTILLFSLLVLLGIYESWYLIKINNRTLDIKDHIIKSAQAVIDADTYKKTALNNFNLKDKVTKLSNIYKSNNYSDILLNENNLILIASESTWLKIYDSKSRLLTDRLLQEGEIFFLPQEEGLVITAENESAIEFFNKNNLQSIKGLYTHNLSDKSFIKSTRFIPSIKE